MRECVAWALVRAWEKDSSAYYACMNAMQVDQGGNITRQMILEELGIDHVRWDMRCKPFLATRFKIASDMLWDGCSKKSVVAMLLESKGEKRAKTSWFTDLRKDQRDINRSKTIKARFLDKRHDWNTVK